MPSSIKRAYVYKPPLPLHLYIKYEKRTLLNLNSKKKIWFTVEKVYSKLPLEVYNHAFYYIFKIIAIKKFRF
jgi:hypothetical protein